MMLFYLILAYFSLTIEIDGVSIDTLKDGYTKLTTPLPRIIAPGCPELPGYPLQFFLSSFNSLKISPVKADTLYLPYPVIPQGNPEILSKKVVDNRLSLREDIYKSDAFYPRHYYTFNLKKNGNGLVLEIILFPYRCNPVRRTLEVVKKFYIEVDGDTVTKKVFLARELYFIGPRNFYEEVEPLMKVRKRRGFDVFYASLEDIESHFPGENRAEKIRNYLKSVIKPCAEQYVALLGDDHIIPAKYLYAFTCHAGYDPRENLIPSDLYYADVDGSFNADHDVWCGELEDSVDLYPDFYVGRIPVGNENELARYVEKVLNYEYISDSVAQYLLNCGLVGQILWSWPYTDGGVHKDYIATHFLPSYFNVSKFYESHLTSKKSDILRFLSGQAHIVNHDGHGWYTAFWLNKSECLESSDTLSFQNYGKSFLVYSIGCWVGALDLPSVAEDFVRCSNGAIAFIANSRYGWGAPGNPGFGYSDIFDNKFFELLFRNRDDLLGKVFWDHKVYFAPFASDTNVYRWIYYELNLLGDPTLYLWRDLPKNFDVTISEIDENYRFTLWVTEHGVPLTGVYATLSCGDSVICKDISDFYGSITFDVGNGTFDSLLLTLWKPGYREFSKWIKIRRSFYFSTYFSEDSLKNYTVWGKKDFVKFRLKNVGLSTLDDTVSFSIDEVGFSSGKTVIHLAPGEEWLDSFEIYFPQGARSNRLLQTSVKGGIINAKSWVRVGWPSISYEGYRFDQHGNLTLFFSNNSIFPLPVKVLGIVSRTLSGSYENLTPASDSFYVLPGKMFSLDISSPISGIQNIGIFFKIFDLFLESTVELSDSILFFDNFEGDLKWWQQAHLFVTKVDSISGNVYLTFDSLYHYEPLYASLSSQWFKVQGNLTLSFRFKYQFPTYGTTGLKVSIVWRGRHLEHLEETVALLGAGGALDSKDIYGNWKTYQYDLKPPSWADSAQIVLRFEKDSLYAFWGLDDIVVRSKNPVREKVYREHRGLELLDHVWLGRNNVVSFLVFSENNATCPILVYDVLGREVLRDVKMLKPGVNVINIDLSRVKSKVVFAKILNETKKVVLRYEP